ncbi:hypothetical protein KNE206_51810 [Kitasatospora sp. NE20-6]|uniref:glycosyltransferase family 2 protein n=1 Tax=Kitasatospora sp. NE20-6 TaxID=2859066 RepID=UPI0034DC17D3
MASTSTATFVMPLYADGPRAADHLHHTVESLLAQTDRDWQLVVVDDASPEPAARQQVEALGRSHPERVFLLPQGVNRGQGFCRNLGTRWAHARGSGIVLFQDADDVAHPLRLEATRRVFEERPDVDFVYSTFTVIDEYGATVAEDRLTPSLREIVESHRTTPVEGPDAWIRMGVDTGYTTLTSTVAVRTALALAHPFPHVRASEDAHAWFRMSAGGSALAYLPTIPCRYRVPQNTTGSADRSRIGDDYYRRKAEVDTDGFHQAISIALERRALDPAEVDGLMDAFLRRLALTMEREGQHAVARQVLEDAGQAAAR